MPSILPPGQHYGTVLQKWESAAFTLSKVRYAAGERNPPHGNAQDLLVFVERGSYAKTVGKSELICTQNGLLFIPARRLQADVFGSTQTTCLLVDCGSSFLQRVHESDAVIRDVTEFSGPEFSGLAAQLFREFRKTDSVSALVFESILLNVFANGFRLYRSSFRPRVPSWLSAARDLLHECFTESFTMECIARRVGVHPVHLSHEFGRYFKMTPGEYLRRLRVDFAAKQLTETSLPLSQIAISSGFADQPHFSRTFHRMMNFTPLEFRRSKRKA